MNIFKCLFLLLSWASMSGPIQSEPLTEISGMRFQCPHKPNCVSSQATTEQHQINPLPIVNDPEVCWQTLINLLDEWTGMTVTHQTENHIEATAKTRWLRFRDDLDFYLNLEQGVIDVRSASRLGYYDFGANRKRVEQIRDKYLNKLNPSSKASAQPKPR